jgi:tetratricopeptide (TPR) repeat protein
MLEPWGAYAARERLLKKALEASPNEPVLVTEMSTFCWSVGRFREALRLAEQAAELNPLMPAARLCVAQMRTYSGDYEASIRMLEDLNQRWPNNVEILVSLIDFASGLGFWDACDRAAAKAAAFQGQEAELAKQRIAYAETLRTGDPRRQQGALRIATAILDRDGTIPLNWIEVVSAMGLVEEAFALAERASFDHMFDPDGPLPGGSYPGTMLGRWSGLNKTPRFVDLCDRLGLCAYWETSGAWPDCVDWTPYDFKALVRRRVAAHASR